MENLVQRKLSAILIFLIIPASIGSYSGMLCYLERYKKNYRPDTKFGGPPTHTRGAVCFFGILCDIILVLSFVWDWHFYFACVVLPIRCILSMMAVHMSFFESRSETNPLKKLLYSFKEVLVLTKLVVTSTFASEVNKRSQP